eukprot:scaffold3909_cov117-Isochrysis_galbana.AAC.5
MSSAAACAKSGLLKARRPSGRPPLECPVRAHRRRTAPMADRWSSSSARSPACSSTCTPPPPLGTPLRTRPCWCGPRIITVCCAQTGCSAPQGALHACCRPVWPAPEDEQRRQLADVQLARQPHGRARLEHADGDRAEALLTGGM